MSYSFRKYPCFVFNGKLLIPRKDLSYHESELLSEKLVSIGYSIYFNRGCYYIIKNY